MAPPASAALRPVWPPMPGAGGVVVAELRARVRAERLRVCAFPGTRNAAVSYNSPCIIRRRRNVDTKSQGSPWFHLRQELIGLLLLLHR